MDDALEKLSARQRQLVAQWLPDATMERDHSWGQMERAVLEVSVRGRRFIVKAGGDRDHHMAREIHAHLTWLEPWVDAGRAPRLLHHDLAARILVTTYLPGELVLGSPAADDPGTYRQAGGLLAQLHGQLSVVDETHEAQDNAKSLAWLNEPHRIPPATVARLRSEIASWPTPPAVLVPTHGDWQPRNWLVDRGRVGIIDFGRALLRPALTDFVRLAAQDFLRDPALEAAFLDGYGSDPREPEAWHRSRVREAIGTAAWAHQVSDEAFEQQGHRMISAALDGTG